MSASQGRRPPGPESDLRELLGRLEARTRAPTADGEHGGRPGAALSAGELEELHRAWSRYCEVIAELEQHGSEI